MLNIRVDWVEFVGCWYEFLNVMKGWHWLSDGWKKSASWFRVDRHWGNKTPMEQNPFKRGGLIHEVNFDCYVEELTCWKWIHEREVYTNQELSKLHRWREEIIFGRRNEKAHLIGKYYIQQWLRTDIGQNWIPNQYGIWNISFYQNMYHTIRNGRRSQLLSQTNYQHEVNSNMPE